MSTELELIDKELENLLLKTGMDFGHSKIIKKMMFILLISENEISMEQLAKKTKYSLATLSNTIKFAEEVGFVERVPYPGTKRVYVRAKGGFYHLIKSTIRKNYENFIPKVTKLDVIEEKYKQTKKSNVKKRLDFIRDVRRIRKMIEKINVMLEEGESG